jgi:hypothetical protein
MPKLFHESCPRCGNTMLLVSGVNGNPTPKCLCCDKIDLVRSSQFEGWAKDKPLRLPSELK